MKHRQLMAMGLSVLLTVSGVGPGYVVRAEENIEVAAETQSNTEAPTEAPKQTEAPRQTEAPVTEAPKQTEAPATEAPVTEAPKPTETPTEVPVTEAPAQTETAATEAPTETAPSTEIITEGSGSEVPSETSPEKSETFPATETGMSETVLSESEWETEEETKKKTDKDGLIEEETEEAKRDGEQLTNEQLIARQNIVIPEDISLEYRFTQVEKVYAVVKNPDGATIYEEKTDSSDVVGTLQYYGLCYILEDKNSDWIYVESGEVRGFIAADDIVTGDAAQRLLRVKGEEALATAVSAMKIYENSAFTYTHTTTGEVLADKVYGVAKNAVNIYEEKTGMSRVIGTLEEGGLCYILADADQDWIYVESGNARGFVKSEQLSTGLETIQTVMETGEMNMPLASVQVKPEDNKACYYTLTSVRKASEGALTRSDMVNYSFQFLGNPYVWGGTSLTNGCDCSGFTQSIYAHFGYYIPRVAEAQASYGTQIPVSSAAPGDLIFYAKDGYVYHVSMYIGDGKVIHAAGTNLGIITSGIGSSAVWATRIIQN